jgi:nitroreductase
MSDFLELCKKRQSCRNFTGALIEHEKLVNCVEAGRLAPSACNSQPWSFCVAETPEAIEKIAKATQSWAVGGNPFTSNAGAFIVVVEEHAVLMQRIRGLVDSQRHAESDIGGAIVSMCYAAEAQGLGSCIIGLYDREMIREVFDIPAEKRIAMVIALGYPADTTVRPKMRKPIEQIARFV